MKIFQLLVLLLTVVCIPHQTIAGYLPINEPPVDVVVEDVPSDPASYELTQIMQELLDRNGGNVDVVVDYLLDILRQLGYYVPPSVLPDDGYPSNIHRLLFGYPVYGAVPVDSPLPVTLPLPSSVAFPVELASTSDLALSNGGYPGALTSSVGWKLANSEVSTSGSSSAGKNVLAGGSTSADDGTFINTKTHSRTRGSSSVGFGMIGGDGGDNNNTVKNGIEYNGGGIVNFLSKVQGLNNQGVYRGNDLFKQFYGSHQPNAKVSNEAYIPLA